MRCRTLYENLPSIYFTLNSAGVILTVSQFGATQLSYTVEELINQSIFSLVHCEDQEKLRLAIAQRCCKQIAIPDRCAKTSYIPLTNATNYKYRVSCKDGRILWVKSKTALVPNTDTHPEIFLVWEELTESDQTEDFTKHRSVEAALRESNEKYRTLFQAFPIGISITDATGKIIEANPASEKILGISITEQIQKTPEEVKQKRIIRPDGTLMPVEEYSSVRALKENRIIENIEEGIVKPGQEVTWMNVTAAPIPLENYGVAITYIDITKHKRAEECLRQSEERYRQLFNNGNDAIFVHGFTQAGTPEKYTTVNDIACQVLGYTRDELLELSPLDIYVSEQADIPVIIENLFTEQHHLFEMMMLTKDGQKVPTEINAHLFELNGQPTVLSIVRDITERKQAEVALQQQFLRERLMGAIQSRIRKSLNLCEILNTTVTEVRQFLQADRVIIYRFEPDRSGVVIVESLGQPWTSMLNQNIKDTCLAEDIYIYPYSQGRIQALEDIYSAGLNRCYVDLLSQYQVRANLVVPILQGENLWGLLGVQHCIQPRKWQPWEIELLKQLATQVGIAIQQAELYQQLEVANQELKRLATLDGLTQLANRRRFDEYLEQEWRRLARERQPLSLILGDVDFFKLYNDTYGHQAGDEALKQVAMALRRTVKRPADLVARYGGEEFALVLPNTNKHGALYITECIHKAVRMLRLVHAGSTVSPYITISLGVVSVIPSPNSSPAEMLTAADIGLYRAKAAGRDRTVLF